MDLDVSVVVFGSTVSGLLLLQTAIGAWLVRQVSGLGTQIVALERDHGQRLARIEERVRGIDRRGSTMEPDGSKS